MAIIIVTHELGSIQMIADQAVMLHQGKVLAAGPLREVQETNHPQIRAFFDRRPRSTALQHGLLDSILLEGERHGKDPA
jgi:phospholipid/cholesterol/gamma-HCH transport system ATP-binding protein